MWSASVERLMDAVHQRTENPLEFDLERQAPVPEILVLCFADTAIIFEGSKVERPQASDVRFQTHSNAQHQQFALKR